jgi:hypothetical protein
VVLHRSEIKKALDDLASDETGFRFQGLAVILAKKRWPDLVASERKRDLGADALAKPAFAAEGQGMVLASSLTADLAKIRADAVKVRDHFPGVTKMVFATPATVALERAENWAAEIQREFGYDLLVMEREEFITSLMDPANASLLSSHLGLAVDLEPSLVELADKLQAASSEVIEGWARRSGPYPLIELRAVRVDEQGKDTPEVLTLAELRQRLATGERLGLIGPAGQGKTTSLVQVGKAHIAERGVSLLIDLPAWASSKLGVLAFVAGMPPFQARAISAADLARANAALPFAFLLNGWNEIGESDFAQADMGLRSLDRDFPSAGIMVATRTHHLVPPLTEFQRAKLLPLTRQERRWYLGQRLGERSRELNLMVDNEPALDDLTRTPFFLSEVAGLYEAGIAIPSAKMGIIGAVICKVEHSREHRNQLEMPPLEGAAHAYLAALATAMTEEGGASLADASGRSQVEHVSTALKAQRQIDAQPGARKVLSALCAHHVLQMEEYPERSFRFQHQQFQEFYAASTIDRDLTGIADKPQEDRRPFAKKYLNEPAWSEPLRMLADALRMRAGRGGEEASRGFATARTLIEMTLAIDPVFAAELAGLCGPVIWRVVRDTVGQRLRALYGSAENRYRRLGVAGMLATGSDDFKDILGPVLAGDAPQDVLLIYRQSDEFQSSSLGDNWRKTVSGWSEQARVQFIWQSLRYANRTEIIEFAEADSSPNVWKAALEALVWLGAWEAAAQFLNALDLAARDGLLQSLDADLIPPALHLDALRALQKAFEASTDPGERIRILLKQFRLGSADITGPLKEELAKIDGRIDDHVSHSAVRPALEIIQQTDPEWTGAWVAERIANGFLWRKSWSKFIIVLPAPLKEALLARLENENFQHQPFGNLIDVLVTDADIAMVERAFLRLGDVRAKITSRPDERHDLEWAVERQLGELLRTVPPSIVAASMARRFADPVNFLDVDVITRIFTTVGRSDAEFGARLEPDQRGAFRAYLKAAVPVVIGQDDFSGELKANIATVLAVVGRPEDMTEMRLLIEADIERVRKGRAAWIHGDRTRRGNGGIMSYADWHVRAVLRIDPEAGDSVLLDLLGEQEYEQAVASHLARRVEPPKSDQDPFRKADYGQAWLARAGKTPQPYPERRKRYAKALADRILELLKERDAADQKRGYEFRLRRLGESLAAIDGGYADLVFEVMAIPDEWNNEPRVSSFEKLLFQGVVLPTDFALNLIEPSFDRCRKYGVQQQDEWLIERYLCLLPFVDDPARGIARIHELIPQLRLWGHHLRPVVNALGQCRCEDALSLLEEIGSDKNRLSQLEDVWVNAVAALDTTRARELLMSFVDPAAAGPTKPIEFQRPETLSSQIAAMARNHEDIRQRLVKLCALDLPPERRDLLAGIIGYRRDLAGVLAGLNLIDDHATPAVPHEIWRQVEAAFVEHRPHGQSANSFTLEPRSSNAVRSKLLEMAQNDPRRQKSALALLAQIEEWRLEYGRPIGEPRHPAIDSGQPWPPIEAR